VRLSGSGPPASQVMDVRLPAYSSTSVPLERLNVVPVEGQALVVHRVVLTPDREHPDFLTSFESSAERGLPPRTGSPEDRFHLIRTGISCFNTLRQAEKTARRLPAGEYVAVVELQPDVGVCVARWGGPGHMTVWYEATALAAMTTRVVDVTLSP